MRRFIIAFFLIVFFNINTLNAAADDIDTTEIVKKQMDTLSFEELENLSGGFDLKETAFNIISGNEEFSIGLAFNTVTDLIFKEVKKCKGMVKNLFLICILCAVIKVLTENFRATEVGEIGFYVGYIVIVILLFSSFKETVGVLNGLVETVSKLFLAVMPLAAGLFIMSGSTSGYIFHPIIFFTANSIIVLTKNFIIPFLTTAFIIEISNYLTSREILRKFSEFMRWCISWIIRGCGILFMGALSLQKISAGCIDTMTGRTVRRAVTMLPIIGDSMAKTVDAFFYWGSAVKSGVSVAIVLMSLAILIIPLIKIIAVLIIYKFMMAIVEPICDRRIVNGLDCVAKYTIIILSASFIVSSMFIFSVIIMLNFSGI